MKASLLLLLFVSVVFCYDEDYASVDDDFDGEVINEETLEVSDEVFYVSPNPTGHVYLAEHFDDRDRFSGKWVLSSAKKDGADDNIAKYDGEWDAEAAEREGLAGDLGLVLKSKAKHAAISTKLDQPFHFSNKPFIVQYDVTFQHGQDCGGAYLKLLTDSDTLNLSNFKDNTPYTIMFGPDKCGNDHKLHFIFRHKNPRTQEFTEKHAKRPSTKIEEVFKDKKPHLFTLLVRPDNTFEIFVDYKSIHSGNLLEDFDPPVNPPEEIDDPDDSKPTDWDEREKIKDPDAVKPDDWDEEAPRKIADPTATKPEGWLDDEPEMIPDPNAEKPDDWNEEMDGDWEAPLTFNPLCVNAPGCGEWQPPQIDNPDYKGKWTPNMIPNPNYKGVWKPARIPNPHFFEDLQPFKMASIGAVGLELWSMSDGLLFDNIIITDDKRVADSWARDTYDLKVQKIDKDADGFLKKWARYTNQHPWLWAVYVLLIGLPLVLLASFCFGGSPKEDDTSSAKKTDAVTPDDPVPTSKPSKSKLNLEKKPEEFVREWQHKRDEEVEEEEDEEEEEEDIKQQEEEEKQEEENEIEEEDEKEEEDDEKEEEKHSSPSEDEEVLEIHEDNLQSSPRRRKIQKEE